jgi:6-phosphogluconolactonase
MSRDIKIFPDSQSMTIAAAETIIKIANAAIQTQGKFTFALAGGSTPKWLYHLLTTEDYERQIDWTKVFFFFGDERNVLPNDEESNFRMAERTLLKPLDINEKQIFRWQTELKNAKEIAKDYTEKIKGFFDLSKNAFPRFDLILLGMGSDGHTASLFPFTKAIKETQKIAVINRIETLYTSRLSLTFPTINNASNAIFLVSGAEKAEALREVLRGEYQPDKFPAQKVKLNNGNLFWMVDEQAAREIQDSRLENANPNFES